MTTTQVSEIKYLVTYWNDGDLTRHVELFDDEETASQSECTATSAYSNRYMYAVYQQDLDEWIDYYTTFGRNEPPIHNNDESDWLYSEE